MGEEGSLAPFYKSLGDVLKQHGAGKEAWIFTRHGPLLKAVGLRPAKRHILFNGALECRLAHFPLFSGSGKEGAVADSPS